MTMTRCKSCGKEDGKHTADCSARGAVLDYNSLPKTAGAPIVSIILFALSCLSLLLPIYFGFGVYRARRPAEFLLLFLIIFMLGGCLLVYVACLTPSRWLYKRHHRHIDGLSWKLSLGSIAAIFTELVILMFIAK
jgi:hypothetical protein